VTRIQFDMPHALVTLTTIEGNVEIEVWPKAGDSAFVVLDPQTAREIAEAMLRLVDEAAPTEAPVQEDGPSNVVDLASRRKPS